MENLSINLKTFLELTPDLVCVIGKDGYLKKVNPAVIEKLGYTEQELYDRHILTFIHPDDMERTSSSKEKLFNGEVLHDFSNRYISKQGRTIWLEWTSVYLPENGSVLAIAKDITARKEIESEAEEKYIKFRQLTTHFKRTIEKDRKYIAYELHEELAQLLSVINFDIGWLLNNEPGLPGNVRDRIEHASSVAQLLIKTIQRLSFSISPQMLDDFGMNSTLEWLCNEFSILNDIPCEYRSAYNEQGLSAEMKIDFFRICQEALLNALDHSVAERIRIFIEDAGGMIHISITDEGAGFSTQHEKKEAALLSIRERAASINGRLLDPEHNGYGSEVRIMIEKQLALV